MKFDTLNVLLIDILLNKGYYRIKEISNILKNILFGYVVTVYSNNNTDETKYINIDDGPPPMGGGLLLWILKATESNIKKFMATVSNNIQLNLPIRNIFVFLIGK